MSVRRLATALGARPFEHDELLAAALESTTLIAPTTHSVLPPSSTERRAGHQQLPSDIAEFTGRAEELTRLLDRGRAASEIDRATAVTICAIVGMGGVGKTRLAIHAAHLLTRDGFFDDVQLWADLHGFHHDQPPTNPVVVLERFLRALGLQDHEIPTGIDERASLYRARLRARRALVLLDDASNEEQIRPLLPGNGRSLVLITSRRSLTGLDGVLSMPLNVFAVDDALDLMRHDAGAERVLAEPSAARHIIDLCGKLPLAVAIAARHLRNRPSWRLADLANRLAVEDRRLAQLSPHSRSVRPTFDLSYQSLTETHKRLFRLLALHPGDDVAAPSVAALANVDPFTAETSLELLLDEHLLQQPTRDRYRMHDLIRLYTIDQTRRTDSETDQHDALVRLLEHYLERALQATLVLHPTEVRRIPAEPHHLSRSSAIFTSPTDAMAWVEAEFANLVDTVECAARSTETCARMALRLILALYRPLTNRGHSSDRIALNQLAVRIARRLNDQPGEAQALEDLATLCGQVGRVDEAIDHGTHALALWTKLGNMAGQQGCLADLGNVYRQGNQFEDAAEYLNRSLEIARHHGYLAGEASALNYLGLVHQRRGQLAQATICLQRSHSIYHELGNRLGEAISIANLGWVQQRYQDAHTALDYHQQALTIFRELGDRYNEAEQLWGLGDAHFTLGQEPEARASWREAISTLRDIGLLDSDEASALAHQSRPETPEIIRLNT